MCYDISKKVQMLKTAFLKYFMDHLMSQPREKKLTLDAGEWQLQYVLLLCGR